jgi:hypothetical protein
VNIANDVEWTIEQRLDEGRSWSGLGRHMSRPFL